MYDMEPICRAMSMRHFSDQCIRGRLLEDCASMWL